MRVCSVQNCDKEHAAKGLCSKHYSSERYLRNKVSNPKPIQGSKRINRHGYVEIFIGKRWVIEHRYLASNALGRKLPVGIEIHHVNEIKNDNRPENLVICANSAYHHLLHLRTRALNSCGFAHYRKCYFCKEYDLPENLVIRSYNTMIYHATCRRACKRIRRNKKNERTDSGIQPEIFS